MNSYGWCPVVSHEFADDNNFQHCKQGECAWWDREEQDCILFSIKNKLKEIAEK